LRVHDCAQFVVGVGAHHLRASAFRVALFDGTWVDVFLDGARYIEADDRHISGAGAVGVVGQYETEPRDAIPVRRIRRAQSIVRTTPSVRESPTLLSAAANDIF